MVNTIVTMIVMKSVNHDSNDVGIKVCNQSSDGSGGAGGSSSSGSGSSSNTTAPTQH